MPALSPPTSYRYELVAFLTGAAVMVLVVSVRRLGVVDGAVVTAVRQGGSGGREQADGGQRRHLADPCEHVEPSIRAGVGDRPTRLLAPDRTSGE